MTATRQGRLKKAAALVPLALLSAAWTVSISTTGAPTAAAGDGQPTLPDGSAVPADALEVPASVTAPDSSSLGVTGESSSQIVQASSAASIPSAALAAYQRAETVINQADTSCHLPWELLAAIGRVESNHGRADGNVLDADGVAQPGIFGKALDGKSGTSTIADTDGGQYDGDTAYDRAVGPMQFIPSTWSTVGVDADGDGQRNPQDIDDAALAAAVYLCSGTDDLATDAGRSSAVYRYNHSSSYVATVLAVMQSYLAGDYTAAPNATVPASYFEPDPAPAKPAKPARHQHVPQKHQPSTPAKSKPAATTPSTPSAPAPTTPSASAKPEPEKKKSSEPKQSVSLPPVTLPSTGVKPVDQVLTYAEAKAQCAAELGVEVVQLDKLLAGDGLVAKVLNALGVTLTKVNSCITGYTN